MNGSFTEIKSLCIRPELLDVFLRNSLVIRIFLNRLFDYFVVNVGEILNKINLVTSVFKITAKRVKNAKRS